MLPDWSAIVLALGLIALALAVLRRRRPPPEHHGPDPIASPESPSVEPRDRAHSAVG
jgi:MYXO-CTERM domain-containing protein